MNTREAAEYLKRTHNLDVTSNTVWRWLKAGHVEGCQLNRQWDLTEECLDAAVEQHNIPRKVGRRSKLTKKQREQIREMFDHKGWTQSKIAKHFGISVSYVSLIVRGLR